MATIRQNLLEAATKLKKISQSPRLDAEVLMCFVLCIDKTALISGDNLEMSKSDQDLFRSLIERRTNSEPVSYLTGSKEFYGLEFNVSPAVLIPRPETELLIELAVNNLKNIKNELAILDLGTGSGCIAVALAHELSKSGKVFRIDAVDVSSEALEVAAGNIVKHKFSLVINTVLSNWFEKINSEKKYNLIISNPPYIPNDDKNVSPELKFEPCNALYSGNSGLDAVSEILGEVFNYLQHDGVCICEIGACQAGLIRERFADKCNLMFFKDLAGHDRAFVASRNKQSIQV